MQESIYKQDSTKSQLTHKKQPEPLWLSSATMIMTNDIGFLGDMGYLLSSYQF